MMKKNDNKINIQLKVLDDIKVTFNKQKSNIPKPYGILVERRNHKVVTNQYKLYNITKKYIKYDCNY